MTGDARFATSWLSEILSAVTLPTGVTVSALSPAAGWTQAPAHSVGRQLTTGMEAVLAVPGSSEAVALVSALRAQATARGLRLQSIRSADAGVVSAINAALGSGSAVLDANPDLAGQLYVSFGAPDSPLTAEAAATLLGLVDGLAGFGEALASYGAAGEQLALLVSQLDPDGQSPTLGALLGLGDAIRDEVFAPVQAYLAATAIPTLGGLAAYLNGSAAARVSGVTVVNEDGRLELRFRYDRAVAHTLNLALPAELSERGFGLGGEVALGVNASAVLEVAVGLDLRRPTSATSARWSTSPSPTPRPTCTCRWTSRSTR